MSLCVSFKFYCHTWLISFLNVLMVLDLLSFISLFFFTFFLHSVLFFFCSRLPCFKVASMLERCSIFYRQLVGRTVQQKVPLVQTHLLKYNYPICLLQFFFLSELNDIFHNRLWQAEVQPTDLIPASNSDCITRIQWLFCLRLDGVGVSSGGCSDLFFIVFEVPWAFCCFVFIFFVGWFI